MKILFFIFGLLTINACSFGGFQPPPPHDHWRLHNADALFPESDPDVLTKYVDRRKKDMTDCGIRDWAAGESDNPEVNLCLEKKGWYLEGGPVCEERLMWDSPICIQWRKKHSKPDAKPWQ